MTRRRGNRKNSTLSIIVMIAFSLVILVAVAILLAPEKDPAPPVSNLVYEDRPNESPSDLLPLGPKIAKGDETSPVATAPDESVDAAIDVEKTPEGAFLISGTVVDKASQAPLDHIRLVASRIPTEDEIATFEAWDAEIRLAKQTDKYDAVLDEKQRLWADEGVSTNAQGRFRMIITHEGDYKITANSIAHLQAVVEKSFVGPSRPEWNVVIEMDTGATISGRVIDGYDKAGISGIVVNATEEEAHHARQATTDEDGFYELSGLGTGSYGVAATIENTAYRVTKELPYKRTKISTPDEKVRNVDFMLDKGGVVWGYVTTPDKKPVRADVVLVTSESILTQALSALVRQAPPLHANSASEDGYYEMVGVPLNEQWRLYATADANAPQLASPFLLTDRQKEARIDIFMFTGSKVLGQVVDSKGVGVPDAKIMCIPGYGEIFAPMDAPKAMRESTSDEEGYFEIAELPVGEYQILAHKEGYKYALRGEPLYSDGYNEKKVRVVLDDIEAGNYDVFGVVKNSEGSPLSGANVTLSGLGTESLQGVGRDTSTDSRGEFRFEGVEIGTYMLRVTHDGYSPKTRGRVLLDENNLIIMETSSIVRGQVLAKPTNTGPEGGFSITATLLEKPGEVEERNVLSFLTDAENQGKVTHFDAPEGTYEITLSSGVWQLEARAEGLTPKRQSISLAPGEDRDKVDFLLTEEGGTIRGRLYITDGTGPQGATVSLLEASNVSQALTDFAQSGGGDKSTQVDGDGAFEFDQLPEGTYYAFARHPAYPQAMSEALFLEPQATLDNVEIRMGPGGTMEGYVYQDGKPMSGWIVTLLANGTPYTGSTDDTGAYDIQNIPAGKFQAFASSPSLGGTGQGEPVVIESGQTTYKNFGDTRGVTLHVIIEGSLAGDLLPIDPATVGGRVSLNPATAIPIVGSGLLPEQLPEESYTVVGSTVTIADVPVGLWRVDYYALESATSGTFVWRSYTEVDITGESEEVEVTLSQY